ncbi:hypothetical protein [Phenylobacterium sp.]
MFLSAGQHRLFETAFARPMAIACATMTMMKITPSIVGPGRTRAT